MSESIASNLTAATSTITYEMTNDLDDDTNTTPGITMLTLILAFAGVFISCIGIVGNIFSIIVLTRKSMKKLSTYAYLLGLSICDEICLIFTVYILLQYCLPKLNISANLIHNHQLSLIYVYPISATTQALSVWITMAFTFDRYLYVCQPFLGRTFCTRKRACIILICLYSLAFVYSIPQFLERKLITHDIEGKKLVFKALSEIGKSTYFFYIYHVFIYCSLVAFIPFTTIVILNGFLVYDIIKSNKRHRGLSLNYRPSMSLPPSSNLLMNANSTTSKRKSIFLKCLFKRNRESNNASKVNLESNNNDNNNNNNLQCLLNNNDRQPSLAPSVEIINHRLSTTCEKSFTFRNDVTIMLIGLIVVFLICQSPSVILRIILLKDLTIQFDASYYQSLDVANFLIVTNSTMNCVLYVMLGKKFRKELLNTFVFLFSYCGHSNNKNSFNNANYRLTRPSISVNVNNQT